jgi:hypothetical protein
MEKIIQIHDPNQSIKQFYAIEGGKERIITTADDTVVQQANYEDRKEDGFSVDRQIRRVARIYMPTVRMLVDKFKDKDAYLYLNFSDEKARDRMIERYPLLFKACSGGV